MWGGVTISHSVFTDVGMDGNQSFCIYRCGDVGRGDNQSFCIYRCGEGWQSVILYLQMWGGVVISHSVFTAHTHTPVCSQIVVFIAKTDVLKLSIFFFSQSSEDPPALALLQ